MKEFGSEYEICPHCGYMTDENPTDKNHLIPGTVLANRYMLGCAIGHGGFGITYIAWDEKIQKKVAVKEYFPNAFSTRQVGVTEVSFYNEKAEKYFKDGLSKMLDEARRISRFSDNENIVDIYDYFEENNTAYIVMEYLEGKDLKKYLDENGGKVSPERAVEIILPVLNALKDMHKENLIHRDISPDNIYMCNNGKVKLLDFGAARLAVEDSEKSLSVMVKRGYAPREQYISSSKQGPWTDVYAVCATIYRMITGEVPSESVERDEEPLKNFAEFDIFNYDQLEKVLFKGLEPSITDRIQSVKTLEKMLLGENVTEEKTYIPQKTVRIPTQKPSKETKSKKSKKILAIILACVIALGGAIAILATIYRKNSKSTLDQAMEIYATKLAEYDIASAYVEDINNDKIPEVFFCDYDLGEQKVMTYTSKAGLCIQNLTSPSGDITEMYYKNGEEDIVGYMDYINNDETGEEELYAVEYEIDSYGCKRSYTYYGEREPETVSFYSSVSVDENVVQYLNRELDITLERNIEKYEKQQEKLYDLIDKKYEDEIIDFQCYDFDCNGTYEAFAAVAAYDSMGSCDGVVVFVSNDGKVVELYNGEFEIPDIMRGEYQSYYHMTSVMDMATSEEYEFHRYIWRVDGDSVVETEGISNSEIYSMDLIPYDLNLEETLIGYSMKYDFCSVDTDMDVFTEKDYYFYETDEGIKEYGGRFITEQQFEEGYGDANTFDDTMQLIDSYGMTINNIIYRENGVVNINLYRNEDGVIYYYYLTLHCGEIYETDLELCQGNYVVASVPEIATYPNIDLLFGW
jgi:serine/threonine protein kinase